MNPRDHPAERKRREQPRKGVLGSWFGQTGKFLGGGDYVDGAGPSTSSATSRSRATENRPYGLASSQTAQPRDGGGATADAELVVGGLEVLTHRARRQPEALRDLRIRLAALHPLEDLALAWREAQV